MAHFYYSVNFLHVPKSHSSRCLTFHHPTYIGNQQQIFILLFRRHHNRGTECVWQNHYVCAVHISHLSVHCLLCLHRSSTAVLYGQHKDTKGPDRQRPHTRGRRCRLQPTLFPGTNSLIVVRAITSMLLMNTDPRTFQKIYEY